MKLKTRFIGLSVLGVLLTATVTVAITFLNKATLQKHIQTEMMALSHDSCAKIALDVHALLDTYHQSLLRRLDYGLRVAERIVVFKKLSAQHTDLASASQSLGTVLRPKQYPQKR